MRRLAGAFLPGSAARALVGSALDPQSARTFTDGPLELAYTGRPAPTDDLLCLLDGHLDNHAELAAALTLPGGLPAETLLAAGWKRWRTQLPARMLGDFLLLVWDPHRGEGMLARDPLGGRSLFMSRRGRGLLFASEIGDLISLMPARPTPDGPGVAHWLAMSTRPGTATMYSGVERLKPGVALALGHAGVRELPYWTPRFREPLACPQPELVERVRGALERAVARRVDPDTDTGVLMSGGLDSSTVAAFAAAHAPGRVQAYAAVFPEHPAVDESQLIETLRGALTLPGVTGEVRPGGLLHSAALATAQWQLPLRSWGDFWALALLRAAAASGVTVMLGGEGGDEVFGVRAYLLADALRAGRPAQALALARELPGAGDSPPRRELASILGEVAVGGALPRRLHCLLARAEAAAAPRWLRREAARDLARTSDPHAWKRLDGPRWWAAAAHGLTQGIEDLGVLDAQRRRAASAGIEARQPMLDLELVELSLRIPPLASFDRWRSRPLLRAATAGLLPDTVRLRGGKALFDSLVVDCLAVSDREAIRSLLCDRGSEIRAYVDIEHVRRELLDSDSLRTHSPFTWMSQVWRLTTAECWLRAQRAPGLSILPTGVAASQPDIRLHPVTRQG